MSTRRRTRQANHDTARDSTRETAGDVTDEAVRDVVDDETTRARDTAQAADGPSAVLVDLLGHRLERIDLARDTAAPHRGAPRPAAPRPAAPRPTAPRPTAPLRAVSPTSR